EWLAEAEHLVDSFRCAVGNFSRIGGDDGYPDDWFDECLAAMGKARATLLDHLRAAPGREPADLANPCDGKEQDAFEAWAKSAKYAAFVAAANPSAIADLLAERDAL